MKSEVFKKAHQGEIVELASLLEQQGRGLMVAVAARKTLPEDKRAGLLDAVPGNLLTIAAKAVEMEKVMALAGASYWAWKEAVWMYLTAIDPRSDMAHDTREVAMLFAYQYATAA